MPAKRRTAKKRQSVTAEAVEAFRAGDWQALYFAIGQRPSEPSPLETWQPNPPEWANDGTEWSQAWPKMYQLRQELEAAK